MTTGGWIIMLTSVGGVSVLFIWCIYKVLTSPEEPEMHGFAFETPDEAEQHAREKQDKR